MKRKLASGPYDHYDGLGSKWFLIAILVIGSSSLFAFGDSTDSAVLADSADMAAVSSGEEQCRSLLFF